MKPFTDLEREELLHFYDPVKAHEYYLRTRKLKGRKPGTVEVAPVQNPAKKKVAVSTRAKQREQLAAAIATLQDKLHKLETLIKQREQEEATSNRKSKAKKERAAKEHTKPKTVADKAKINRENKKYRDKNKQKLRATAKQRRHTKTGGSSGGSPGGNSSSKNPKNPSYNVSHKISLSELKSLAIKVRGQIQVAKQKLAAL